MLQAAYGVVYGSRTGRFVAAFQNASFVPDDVEILVPKGMVVV